MPHNFAFFSDINKPSKIRYAILVILLDLLIISTLFASFVNHTLACSIIGFMSVSVSFTIVFVSRHTFFVANKNFFSFLSIAILASGSLELLFILSHEGYVIFKGNTPDLAAQLWLTARIVQATALVLVFVFMKKRINPHNVALVYAIILLVSLMSIFQFKAFPSCYSPEKGYSMFFNTSSLLATAIIAAGLVLMIMQKNKLNATVSRYMLLSYISLFISQFFSLFYRGTPSQFNLLAEVFKLAGLYLIFKSQVETNIRIPLRYLYNKLNSVNEKLKQEIIECQNSEEIIRKEKEVFQKYLFVAGVMFVVVSKSRKVLLINKKGCEILGYSEDEILEKDWIDNFIPPIVRDEVRDAYENALSGDIDLVEYYESTVLTKYGEERNIAWHNTLLTDDSGSITAILSSGTDITERKRMEAELSICASTDQMTGAINRTTGLKQLETLLQLSKLRSKNLTICFVDVNGLKRVNDSYGHNEGDSLIINVCTSIKESIREADILIRLGGDEFLIVFPDSTIELANLIWSKIKKRIVDYNLEHNKPYGISVSTGFAQYSPLDPKSMEELINLADNLMYAQKTAHKQGFGSY